MPTIIKGNKKLGDALKEASKKAKRRDESKHIVNQEVIGQCDKCKKDIHIADKHYGRGIKIWCPLCKPKNAKEYHVIKGAFKFSDVLKEMKRDNNA